MSQSRKRRRKKQQQPASHAPTPLSIAQTGEIPWSLRDLGDVLLHAAELHNTPRDDWDRRQRGVNIAKDDGSVTRLVFSPDMLMNQLGSFMMQRFREQKLTEDAIMSHMWRFFEIQGFLAEHSGPLPDTKACGCKGRSANPSGHFTPTVSYKPPRRLRQTRDGD